MAESSYKWINLQERKEVLEIFTLNDAKGIVTNCAEIARKYNVSRTTISRMRNIHRRRWENSLDSSDSDITSKRKKISKILNLEDRSLLRHSLVCCQVRFRISLLSSLPFPASLAIISLCSFCHSASVVFLFF